MAIRVIKEHHDLSRFWELFAPVTNNFQFWLASAAFSFFVYTSLVQNNTYDMSLIEHIEEAIAYFFLSVGFLCIFVLFYLFISWIFHFKIDFKHARKSKVKKKK